MPFAQLVIGPPGSGKSTYCDGMHQFMSTIGRKCSVVNLDPANDRTSYPCALDVRDLVKLDDIMAEEHLGPNGGTLWAIEELEHNIEWLEKGLVNLGEDYVLFDCPGQVEIFTHHSSLRNIFFRIQKLGYRLVAIHLTDSYCLTLPSLYISTLLLSLRAMLQMDLPHLNVLTKIDNLASYAPLPFNLDFYAEVQDLSYLLPHLAQESPHLFGSGDGDVGGDSSSSSETSKFHGLNRAIVEMVEDFGLVSFETLAVEDKRSMMKLLQATDRASGYAFGGAEGANDTVWQVAMREGTTSMDIMDVQERWLDAKDAYDEEERKRLEEEMAAARHGLPGDGDGTEIDAGAGGGALQMPSLPPDSGAIKVVRKKKAAVENGK